MADDATIARYLMTSAGLNDVCLITEGHTCTARDVDPITSRCVFAKVIEYVPEYEEEILRERRLLCAAVSTGSQHEHVVGLYSAEVRQIDGEPHLLLLMEHVDGQSLRSRLETHGAFAQRDAVARALELTKGAVSLHARGVLHRDLKRVTS